MESTDQHRETSGGAPRQEVRPEPTSPTAGPGLQDPSGPPPSGSQPAGSAPTDRRASSGSGEPPFDFRTVPGLLLRVLSSPENGLASIHRPGPAGLIQGLVLAPGAIVLVVFLQLLACKIGGVPCSLAATLKALVGGLAYLGTGILMSMLLRATAGRVRNLAWADDLCMFGGATTFVLGGTLLGTVFVMFGYGSFLGVVGRTLTLMGLVMSGFAYCFSLSRIGRVPPERAVWIVPVVFTVALVIGQYAWFRPLLP